MKNILSAITVSSLLIIGATYLSFPGDIVEKAQVKVEKQVTAPTVTKEVERTEEIATEPQAPMKTPVVEQASQPEEVEQPIATTEQFVDLFFYKVLERHTPTSRMTGVTMYNAIYRGWEHDKTNFLPSKVDQIIETCLDRYKEFYKETPGDVMVRCFI